MRALTARERSFTLHGLWVLLSLGANRIDRAFQRVGVPKGVSALATIVGWYGLLGMLERRRPHDPDWQPPGAEVANDGAFLASTTVVALVGQGIGGGLAGRYRKGPGAVTRLGVSGGVVASLLTSEFIHYSLHRLTHEWGPGWKFHSVHHSPARLHIYNATRFHPAESFVEGILEGAALGVVGFGPEQHVTHAAARSTYGQLQHANIELDSGPLDHAFATPDLHRWHHSEIYAEGDNNYGAVLSVWDKLFGTFFRPERPLDARLGIGRMPDFPQRFVELLATPFRWAAIKHRNRQTWYAEADVNPDIHPRS